jgi:uroporphyrinogen decarboxylase
MSVSDAMTPMERVLAAAFLKEPDRVPVLPFDEAFQANLAGFTLDETRSDVEKHVKAQLKTLRELGYDGVFGLGFTQGTIDLSLAPNVKVSNGMPSIFEPYLIQDYTDIEKLKPPLPSEDKRMRHIIEVVRSLKKAVGPDVPVIARKSAPFEIACMLRGSKYVYKDMRRKPEFVHQILDIVTEADIVMGQALIEAGGDIVMCFDPTASGTCISKKDYATFALPYNQKMIKAMKKAGAKAMLMHICGDTTDRLDLLVETGANILSLDQVDFAAAKEQIGKKACLMGNIDLVKVLYKGMPQDVETAALECIMKAGKGGGFVLAGSCAISAGTPVENVAAISKAAKKYGTYPLQI